MRRERLHAEEAADAFAFDVPVGARAALVVFDVLQRGVFLGVLRVFFRAHLHAQLAQLTAHVSDLENLLRVTAVQAESMRNLGGYAGALYVPPQR